MGGGVEHNRVWRMSGNFLTSREKSVLCLTVPHASGIKNSCEFSTN